MSDQPHFTIKKGTFLSSTVLGLSAIFITLIVSCTVVIVYTVRLAGEKSERVITLTQDAVRGLPELTENLPPAVADMLNDQRQPEYCQALTISARLSSEPNRRDTVRTIVEVANNGDEVVSLLSLRIVLVNGQGHILNESSEWAATPFAADGGWRGPIMPGSKRLFISHRSWLRDVSIVDEVRGEVEITELRVWNRDNQPSLESMPEQQTAVSVAQAERLPESG